MAWPPPAPELLDELLDAAIHAARVAAAHFRNGYADRAAMFAGMESKSGPADLVTATDKLCESVIVEELKKRFPSHAFVGEEGVAAGAAAVWPKDDRCVWIIDPIDGTTNFAHGLDAFTCISIGCAIRGTPVVGVVYAPIVDQLFSAAVGRGATLNGTKLPLFSHFAPLSLSTALVITEFGHSTDPVVQKPKQDAISKLVGLCRGIRAFGSAAMNMCRVACGGPDSYYEKGIHCWDVAAACVILREAGGMVVNYAEGPKDSGGQEGYDIRARDVLCVRQCAGGAAEQGKVVEELRAVLATSGALAEQGYERD
ncbi:hypothetical protein DFJ74DRAFT_670835 [Hyaloraphidium curvatum]|nr:hypothetical protein DFJ74DRAFT_670835 [Hyaloraphidium curvatum]